jgi:SAM-dependent methyltransferase
MKRVVFLDELSESELRSGNTYRQYKKILLEDIKTYFPDRSRLAEIACPGCSDKGARLAFSKMGLDYRECTKCGSLFASPRPSDKEMRSFYKDSRAGHFQRERILGSTRKSRRNNILSYRVHWITGLIEEYLPDAKVFLDYGTKYPWLLSELRSRRHLKTIISILPECFEEESSLRKTAEIMNTDEVGENSVDGFAAFEVVERVFDVQRLLDNAYRVCRQDGLLIITSSTSSGFEYQALGSYSPNIVPFDRINLLSLEALVGRIEKAGFEIIEVSTPGRLDLEIVKKVYEEDPDIPLDPFWKYVLRHRSEDAGRSFQEWLQRFQLSAHVRIAAKKVEKALAV